MNGHLTPTPTYDPMADLRRRYPRWRINFSELPTAPMVATDSAHMIITMSLCHLARDQDLTIAVAAALLDIRYDPRLGEPDQAVDLARERLGRVSPHLPPPGVGVDRSAVVR